MRVVIDTNVLLISLPTKSEYRPIFDGILDGKFELAISNEILSEYAEILEQKTNAVVASNITELLLNLDNVIKTEVFFTWKMIHEDEDDNKYVDCAVASNAKYLVSNDRHFQVLKTIDFPKIEIIRIEEFLKELQAKNP